MPRIMRDSTVPGDIPLDGTQLVLGYGNGNTAWDQAGWARFAHIPRATVDVTGQRWWSDVLDWEQGDVQNPQTLVNWVATKHAHALIYPPIIYVNRSNVTAAFNALNGAGFQIVRDFRLGVGTLDGTKEIPDMTGVTFVQYAGEQQTGGHYDESIVYDDAWMPGVPLPGPPQQQPRHLVGIEVPDGTVFHLTSTDGAHSWH